MFTLGLGRISWLPSKEKGQAWKVNQLNFYSSLDTRTLTAEGTQQVIEEKVIEITKTLNKMKQKDNLSDEEQAFITRNQSTLDRINIYVACQIK